ncbi:uncharacterized protein [Periplaneta americana]|uniref:uncharacterized protein isoform X4 n=1 Tax=Periplaneta americana TaxID=6978 RepID=UPI0037E8900F
MEKNRLSLQKAHSVQFDLEQKIVALEQEITNLNQQLQEYRENEGENMIITAGLSHNTAELKQEVEELKQNLEDSRMREQLLASSSKESSPVLEKLKVPAPYLLVGDFNASHHSWDSNSDDDRGNKIAENVNVMWSST